MGAWILGKQGSKTGEQVTEADAVEQRNGSGQEAIYVRKGSLCSLLPRGLECPEISRFPVSGLSVLSCPFKTSKKHSPNQNNNSNNERGNRKKHAIFFFSSGAGPSHLLPGPAALLP